MARSLNSSKKSSTISTSNNRGAWRGKGRGRGASATASRRTTTALNAFVGQKRQRREPPTRDDDDGTEQSEDSDDGFTIPAKRKKVAWGSEIEEEELGLLGERQEKSCLAITCQKGRLGCAFYEPSTTLIHLLEDVEENHHYDLTKIVLEQTNPDVVLSSSKSEDHFMDVLRDHMEGIGLFQVRPHREFVPEKGRERLLSLKLLSELPSTEETEDGSQFDQGTRGHPRNLEEYVRQRGEAQGGNPVLKRWNAAVRISNFANSEAAPLCISSAGALLDYLVRVRTAVELDDLGVGGLEIEGIQSLSLDLVMQINADALSSLQVFDDQNHASIHSEVRKEGLSLYGILNHTRTVLGRNILRQWLARPSLSLDIIKSRHDTLECFTMSANIATTEAMQSHLKGTRAAPRMLALIKTGKATLIAWQVLVKFIFHCTMLRECLSELEESAGLSIIHKVKLIMTCYVNWAESTQLEEAIDVPLLNEIGGAVDQTIDWEESDNAGGRVCVKPLIDRDLDEWKHMYQGLDVLLFQVAKQESATVPQDWVTSVNVVYFPQLGFLICVPLREEWTSEDDINVVQGWVFQFSSDESVYFKSDKMRDMDNHIGDVHHLIVDREIEIIQNLQDQLLEHHDRLLVICDICGELDCLLSLAEASRLYEYVRPIVTEDNVIDIRQGRHPLQERVVDVFVPNDCLLVGGAGMSTPAQVQTTDTDDPTADEASTPPRSILVCTGANACGKSVFLKQAALICIMAQIGCFVPATSANLGLVDKIFTRVHTKETVSKMQSAFMIDLHQVSLALRNATVRSLCIFDEFGKGTKPSGSLPSLLSLLLLPAKVHDANIQRHCYRSAPYSFVCLASSPDGAGLFCGMIKSLLDRGPDCPKVLAATHFHEIMKQGMLDPNLPVAFMHMQVMISSNDQDVTTDIAAAATEGDDGKQYFGPNESITYLFRVAKGLCSESHASKCALMWGIPLAVVQRAEYVSGLLVNDEMGKLADEQLTDVERMDLKDAEAICRGFLMLDLTSKDLDTRAELTRILGRQKATMAKE